jgi:hypothetical protein
MADVLGRIDVGMAMLGKPGESNELKAVSLFWPKAEPVTDDPEDPVNFEALFMTIPCAKELILDLQGAINALIEGKAFNGED